MTAKKRLAPLAAAVLWTAAAAHAQAPSAAPWLQPSLWQESTLFDGLLHARDKAARQSADPNLLPVVKAIAQQTAQQALNLQQIQVYAKAQQDNLRFAFSQKDPGPSLYTIQANLSTLSKGAVQVKNNLYYLTARVRMASTQALPEPELTKQSMILIGQVQAIQLQLNALYADSTATQALIQAEDGWLHDKFLRYNADALVKASMDIQSSVFSVYNASYELYMRSK